MRIFAFFNEFFLASKCFVVVFLNILKCVYSELKAKWGRGKKKTLEFFVLKINIFKNLVSAPK